MNFIQSLKSRLLGIAGALFLLLAGFLLVSQFLFLYSARRTFATVVDQYTYPTEQSIRAAVYPVLRFTTPQGQAVTARSTMGNYPPRYEIDQRVEIWYNPARPERMKVVSLGDQIFEFVAALLLGFIGLVLVSVQLNIQKRIPAKQQLLSEKL